MNGKKSGGGPEPNRLIHESSPYLRQHALNPVDWFPWSPEAFARAAREDKPVFLSIGYSTCHWCHVMERESFEDPETAALMNRVFVSIKVDREERPDIDAVYMEVCQALTGSGGWPMTLFLTPDRKPFFAATYLPRTSRFGRPGLRELIPRIESFWKDRRGDLLSSADEITAALRRPGGSGAAADLGESARRAAFRRLSESYDPRHGGFSPAPKFPMPSHLGFLLRYAHRTGDRRALDMVETTLAAMRGGGVYDQLGYGFHRYSTDREWRLPHFEKMLYDQALTAMVYVEAFQVTGRPLFRSTAEEILGYVLRDMTSSDGGFFTAEDADSEGEEGRFYTWEMEEVREALSREDFEEAKRLYDLRPEGNFREEAGSGPAGRNILMPGSTGLEAPGREVEKRRARIRRRLFEIREKRERPFLDRTVLTDWNGLMIAALARAGRALDSPEYISAATRAAEFLLGRARGNGTRLLHRHDDTGSAVPGFASDYAFLAWGLVELFQADFRPARLTSALGLMESLLERFWDDGNGGFFQTSDDAEDLLLRPREYADGAVPSSNSAALDVLLRLGRLTGRTDLEEKADALIRAASGPASRHPAAFTHFLQGLDFSLDPTREIVIAGRRDAPDTRALLEVAARRFLPDSVLLLLPEEQEDPDITGPAPFTSGLPRVSGPARAFICRDYACRRPISDPAEFKTALETGSGPAPDTSKST